MKFLKTFTSLAKSSCRTGETGLTRSREILRRTLGTVAVGTLALSVSLAHAQISGDVVKIGVLTDMEASFSVLAGPGSVLAAKMAVEDFGGKVAGKRIEVVSADHQNKPDVASTVARSWYDSEGVDIIVDVAGSPIALAVQELARQRKKMLIVDAVTTLSFVDQGCSNTGIMWLFTGYSNAKALGKGVVEAGGKNWFFLTLDTAGGTAIASSLVPFVTAAGGKVVGTTRFPLTGTDFSSNLLQAQASKADIFAIASAGGTVVGIIKQGEEFQSLRGGAKFLVPFTYITEIHALGLQNAKGTIVVEPFYWDLNPESRAFSRRFYAQHKAMPTAVQAGVYTSIMHYLRAVQKANTDDGPKVAETMRATPINDFMTKNGTVLANGDVDRQRYVFEVKKPEESKEPWDYYKLVKTFAPSETARSVSESSCPLLKKAN